MKKIEIDNNFIDSNFDVQKEPYLYMSSGHLEHLSNVQYNCGPFSLFFHFLIHSLFKTSSYILRQLFGEGILDWVHFCCKLASCYHTVHSVQASTEIIPQNFPISISDVSWMFYKNNFKIYICSIMCNALFELLKLQTLFPPVLRQCTIAVLMAEKLISTFDVVLADTQNISSTVST